MREKAGHFYGRRKGKPLKAGRISSLQDTQLIIDDVPTDFLKRYKHHVLEIGFGNGEHLVAQAIRHADTGFIGCEAFINGVTACIQDAQQNRVENIRLWAEDAMLLLPQLPPTSFDTIYLLFSDPWPKTRHHKRRFIQKETASLLARLLKPQGVLRLATDDTNLAQWMLLGCVQEPLLHWKNFKNAEWRQAPQDWVETRYQQKAAQQGRLPYFMDFIKL